MRVYYLLFVLAADTCEENNSEDKKSQFTSWRILCSIFLYYIKGYARIFGRDDTAASEAKCQSTIYRQYARKRGPAEDESLSK